MRWAPPAAQPRAASWAAARGRRFSRQQPQSLVKQHGSALTSLTCSPATPSCTSTVRKPASLCNESRGCQAPVHTDHTSPTQHRQQQRQRAERQTPGCSLAPEAELSWPTNPEKKLSDTYYNTSPAPPAAQPRHPAPAPSESPHPCVVRYPGCRAQPQASPGSD